MKKLIITQIAKQYRAKITKAKNVQSHHLSYMYGYTVNKLLKTYYKALTL